MPDETVVEIQDSRIPGVDTTPTSGSVNLITSGGVSAAIPTKTSDLTNDSGFMTGMTILSYGHSTWQDFMNAYTDNKVVYCRASSNPNPATGAQSRMAFMAYVGGTNQASPTNVEFQYYRSVSSHTITQQGDQVFVYTLKSNGTWSVITREATAKVVAGTGLTSTYANDTLTLNATAVAATATPLMDGTAAVGTATKYAREDHVHPSDSSKANDSAVVHNTGNETIAGDKTFSGFSSFAGSEFGGDVDFIDATIYNESATDFDWIQDGNGYSVQDALDAILPSITASDNGKGLVVSNGAWAAGTLNYLPTSGGTVSGVLGVGNTNACKLHFQRDAANYITAVTGGYFCFGPNGADTTVAASSLVIEDGCIYSGKTSNLGKNDHFWYNGYISNLYLSSSGYLAYDSTEGLTYNGNTVYHAGNSNKSDVNWACQNLTASGYVRLSAGQNIQSLYNGTSFQLLSTTSDGKNQLFYGRGSGDNLPAELYGNGFTFYDASRAKIGQLSNDGNLSINGATAPTLSILVNGNANVSDGSIFFGNTGGRNGFKISSIYSGSGARQDLAFYRSNNTTSPYAFTPTEMLRLKTDGTTAATGNITATGTITPGSDSRIKDNQKEIPQEDAFSIIESLKPKTWVWNKKSGETLEGKTAAGLVAQEVKEILPDAVTITKTEDFEDFHSLNYNTIQGYEIAAIKGLLKEVKALKAEIVELKNKLNNK